jgi:catalase
LPNIDVIHAVLQARLFAYSDAQRYRLGANFIQLPVNRPFYSYTPTQRDGAGNFSNLGSLPNYLPSSFGPKIIKPRQSERLAAHEKWIGTAVEFETEVTDEDFVQGRQFWEDLGQLAGQQENLVGNVAGALSSAIESVRKVSYGRCYVQTLKKFTITN